MTFATATPESELVILSDRDKEYLVRAIESALHVRTRHQFFLWAQGQLRGLLPHKVLAAIRFDKNQQVEQIEFFHGRLLDPEQQEALCHPAHGLAIRLARLCDGQHRPLLLSAAVQKSSEGRSPPADLAIDFHRCATENALVCITDGIVGGQFAFVLFDVEDGPSYRQAYLLDLMLPHLQVALVRLQGTADGATDLNFGPGKPPITQREVEILRLVQRGSSNHDIGAALGISPQTVKNHTQKIFRKLKVQNRAHAVSRGIALRVLDSTMS